MPPVTERPQQLVSGARRDVLLVQLAKQRRTYPVALLEGLVKEKFNPYGHTDVKDSAAYVRMLRRRSRKQSDAAFLKEIRAWQRSASS